MGCFYRTRINPRNLTQRNTAIKRREIHFCSIWKSDGISFDKAIKELKDNFKVVENVVSDKHVKGYLKYDYNPNKVKSPLTNIMVYYLETFNKIRAVPYCSCKYKLSKTSGNYHRDISERE